MHTNVSQLLWATLWVFFVDFRFIIYVLFRSKFDLNNKSDMQDLDDCIDRGIKLFYIFTLYCSFFLFPYLTKLLIFLTRKQKIFVMRTGGLGLIVVATQYPEKLVAKIKKEMAHAHFQFVGLADEYL